MRHLGDALWLEGDTVAAMKQYHRARKRDRRDVNLAYTMGELSLAEGARARGRGYLLAALREDPRFHRARLRLAEDLLETGEPEAAKFHARLLVEYDPDHGPSRELMAKIMGNTTVRTFAEATKKANENIAKAQDEAAAEAERPDKPPPTGDEFSIELEDA
jgi:tetratricopeptide (TPR) repeat protein